MKHSSLRITWLAAWGWLLVSFTSCFKSTDHSPVIEKTIPVTGFSKIYAGEQFHLVVQKGDSFLVKVKGPSDTVNDIDWDVNNQILDIRYQQHWKQHPVVEVFITLPDLVQLNLSGAATGTVAGFQGTAHVLRTVLSGSSNCTITGTGASSQVDLSGSSQITISGTTGLLYGNLSGGSRLNAYGLAAESVDIAASGGSLGRVSVSNRLDADASGGSRIFYRGDPSVKNITISGGGRVIRD